MNQIENKEQLIFDNIPLIHKAIKDLHCVYKNDDEYQEYYDWGLEGLIRGAKTYDSDKAKQSTYLYTCIKNMILRYFQLSEMNVRKINKIPKLSLNQMVSDDSDTELLEMIPNDSISIEEEVERRIQLEAILNAINKMPNEKDKIAIKMYYGLEGYQPHTYEQIGEKLGVTREMIRYRINRALKRIKTLIKKEERNVIVNTQKTPIYGGEYMESKNPLDQVNLVLLEQLSRLKNIDLNNKEEAKLEIARSNAISSTSKTILQTIGIQMMAQKQNFNLLSMKNK